MSAGSPPATAPLDADEVEVIVAALGRALQRDAGGRLLPLRHGFRVLGVAARTFRKRVPVVSLARGETTLCFIVTRTNPAEPAYRRTRHYDVTYFSEDVPDADQHRVYARDREMIDAFARYVAAAEGSDGSFR